MRFSLPTALVFASLLHPSGAVFAEGHLRLVEQLHTHRAAAPSLKGKPHRIGGRIRLQVEFRWQPVAAKDYREDRSDRK